jgi:hypothetical protein
VHEVRGIPRGDAKGRFRQENMFITERTMKTEAVVNMAFAELEARLGEGGGKASKIEPPLSGEYKLYSSDYLIKCQLDNIDTGDFCDDFAGRTILELGEDGEITFINEHRLTCGIFDFANEEEEEDISCDGINIEEPTNLDYWNTGTNASCTGVANIWLTGDGYLRLQIDM